jgi:type 1 glutamine amidotransferase
MPMIAWILEDETDVLCQVLYAVNPDTGARDPQDARRIDGLEALDDADLAVFFLRDRKLPNVQLDAILRYVQGGNPVAGLRSSLHAFQYDGGENVKWNDEFGLMVFGQNRFETHPSDTTTRVKLHDLSQPLLRGVPSEFECPSPLYKVGRLPEGCTVIAYGEPVKGGVVVGEREPIAWTRFLRGRRVFYTSLGHPKDFEVAGVRRMVIQSVLWCLGSDSRLTIPSEGLLAQPQRGYTTPKAR